MNYHNLLFTQFARLVDDPLIWAFIWAVLFDIFTGVSKSIVTKNKPDKTNSTKGLNGLIKHVIVLFLVITIYPFLETMGFNAPANTIIVFYILIYAISILENLGQMGIKVPQVIKDRLLKLQDDYNSKEEEDK